MRLLQKDILKLIISEDFANQDIIELKLIRERPSLKREVIHDLVGNVINLSTKMGYIEFVSNNIFEVKKVV